MNLQNTYAIWMGRFDHTFECDGWSLLEVLVSLSILTAGLLSIAGAEVTALQRVYSAHFTSLAVNQVANIIECVRADSLAHDDYAGYWNQDNSLLLPRGSGSYNMSRVNISASLCWLAHTNIKNTNCYALTTSR